MRWRTAAAGLCMAMACASTVGADGTPQHKRAADQNKSIHYEASGGVFAARPGVTAATPVQEKDNPGVSPFASDRKPAVANGERVRPDRSANITRSNDGSMFRVELGSMPEPVLQKLGEQSATGGGATRGEGCGDPESGSCFEANGSPYCDDEECCNTVCYEFEEEHCCTEEWNEDCASMAGMFCGGGGGGCGDPESGSCCEANYTPYCDDGECCEIVCYMMGYEWCCDEEGGGWDDMCAEAAQEYCGDTCGPPTAACCFDDQCAEMERMDCELAGGSWFHGAHCASFECPGCPSEGSLFSQSVHDWGSFYTTYSDLDSGYSIHYERFWDVQGDICGVRWGGITEFR